MQRIVVWGMKCVSYDYEFETDLATRWKALNHPAPEQSGRTKRSVTHKKNRRRQTRGRQRPIQDDSEDEGGLPMATPRDHLPRKARRGGNTFELADIELVGGSDSEDRSLSDDDDGGLFHDATGGEPPDQE